MSDATIEVGGEVYELASSTMHDNTQTYTTASGDLYVMRIGAARAHAMTKDFAAQALVKGAPHPCRLTLGGLAYTGHVWVEGWSHSDQQVDLIVENLEPIPAAPTLDELTDPADLDWGTIRSTCAARDWRAAWGVVGTDHTGDATPGEVYLLAVARRASATAAALCHWRHVCEKRRDVTLAPGNVSWQRIKRIAAWESSARAQYDERGNRRGRLQAAVRAWRGEFADTTVRPTNMWIDEATLNALRQQAAVIDDPVEPDPELYGNGRGVVGVLNNPFLSATAQRGEITGTVTILPGTSDMIPWQRPNTSVRATGHVGIATHPTNPAPRGPQTRKRR